MAASGFLADFAKMPPARKALVFVVVGMLLGALYYQFGYKGLAAQVEEARASHEDLVTKNKTAADNIPKYEKLKERDLEIHRIIDENQKALPTEAELPAFFETLSRKVNEAGVEVTKWSYRKEETVESFVKVPVEIEMTGTFLQIKRFFASLVQADIGPAGQGGQGAPAPGGVSDAKAKERDRIVSIDSLTLTAPTVRNGEIVLTARFVAATFRQEAPAAPTDKGGKPGDKAKPGEPAKPGDKATPDKPGLPPPPTDKPGLPPPPGAGTPAGAKARTEDALETGATRNSNAAGVDEAKTPSGSGVDRLKKGM